MYRKTLSLVTGLLAVALIAGLSVPSRAGGTGRVYVYGNVKMPDGSMLRVYVETRPAPGGILGNIALLGPDGRAIAYMKQIDWHSNNYVTVYGDVVFGGVPAQVQVDISKVTTGTNDPDVAAMIGWKVVGADGTILWASGVNADGTVDLYSMKGMCFLLPPH